MPAGRTIIMITRRAAKVTMRYSSTPRRTSGSPFSASAPNTMPAGLPIPPTMIRARASIETKSEKFSGKMLIWRAA